MITRFPPLRGHCPIDNSRKDLLCKGILASRQALSIALNLSSWSPSAHRTSKTSQSAKLATKALFSLSVIRYCAGFCWKKRGYNCPLPLCQTNGDRYTAYCSEARRDKSSTLCSESPPMMRSYCGVSLVANRLLSVG